MFPKAEFYAVQIEDVVQFSAAMLCSVPHENK